MKWLIIFILLWCSSGLNALPSKSEINITEWKVPWPDSRPRDPAIDSKGNVWFCGQVGNYIGVLNPTTGKFKRFELADNTNPHNLLVDSNDFIWYAGNRNNHIGLLNPKTGAIEQFIMPSDIAIDPHTLVFNSTEQLWFTAQWGNKVGFLSRQTKAIKLIGMPIAKARPYGIKVDHDDAAWIVLFGSNHIARIDPQTFAVELIELVDQQERPRRLEISQNNDIFYLDHSLGYLGRYQTNSKMIKRWLLPEAKNAKLYGSAIDNNDRVWLALTGMKPNKIIVFDSKSQQFIASRAVASGGGSIRYMYYHGESDSVWFGTDANTIGRARLKNND